MKVIKDLLLKKHHKDICIPECKTGPTWFAPSCPRLDFVAIKRSWSDPYIYGYEIKKSRNDFLRDEKWREYLKFCTDFYFVAVPKIIDKNELPEEAGLMVTSANCKRLFTIKKAPSRSVEIPESLYRYILICRAEISPHDRYAIVSKAETWRAWLKVRDEEKHLGRVVSKKIQEIVKRKIDEVSNENDSLKHRIEGLQEIKDFIISLGISEDDLCGYRSWRTKDRLKEIISEKKTGIPGGLSAAINSAINSLKNVGNLLNESTD